jgi:hypothetical protein
MSNDFYIEDRVPLTRGQRGGVGRRTRDGRPAPTGGSRVSLIANKCVLCVYPGAAEEAAMATWEHGAQIDFGLDPESGERRWVIMRPGSEADPGYNIRRYPQQRVNVHVPVLQGLRASHQCEDKKNRIVPCESRIVGDEIMFLIPSEIEFEREGD